MKRNDNLPLNLIEKMNARVSMIASVIVLALVCIVFNRMDYYMIRKPAQEARAAMARQESELQEEGQENQAVPASVATATVVAVGDNLLTDSLIGSGRFSTSWNYDHLYSHVKADIEAADVAVVSQETPMISSHDEVSGSFPYATPMEVGDALVGAGFDVVSLATEYIAASGQGYLAQTVDYWNEQPMIQVLGVHEASQDTVLKFVDVNDIRIAFLNYCLPIQGRTVDITENRYGIDTFHREKIAAKIAEAKQSADCVIFCAHWGKNQEPMPTEYEKEWAAFLLEQDVDVVLGSYPRVLSPYVTLQDEEGHSMLVYYSLGGFISTGDTLKQLLGGMASFTIQKTTDANGSTVTILNPSLTPLVMHYDYDNAEYGVYKLADYTDALAEENSVGSYYGEDFNLSRLNTKLDEILSMQVTPSTKTYLLDVVFDEDGNMYRNGDYVEDTDSITSGQYYERLSSGDEQ